MTSGNSAPEFRLISSDVYKSLIDQLRENGRKVVKNEGNDKIESDRNDTDINKPLNRNPVDVSSSIHPTTPKISFNTRPLSPISQIQNQSELHSVIVSQLPKTMRQRARIILSNLPSTVSLDQNNLKVVYSNRSTQGAHISDYIYSICQNSPIGRGYEPIDLLFFLSQMKNYSTIPRRIFIDKYWKLYNNTNISYNKKKQKSKRDRFERDKIGNKKNTKSFINHYDILKKARQ